MGDETFTDDGRSTNDRPTSALDNVTRQNLLNVVLERTRNTNKKCLLHRLIYMGRLNPDVRNPIELGEHYENSFRNAAGNFQTEPVSGLLLIYPSHFVHILEGPEKVLFDVIEESGNKEKSSAMLESKVVVFSHNITARLFSIWTFRVLSLTAVRMDRSKIQESFETNISDALTLIYKLANELFKLNKAQLKGALDQLSVKYSNFLLPQDLIESSLSSNELLSLPEYKAKYLSPLHVTLDEELVWPVQEFPPQL